MRDGNDEMMSADEMEMGGKMERLRWKNHASPQSRPPKVREGKLNFVLSASKVDGTQLKVRSRSSKIMPSICNKQAATPF